MGYRTSKLRDFYLTKEGEIALIVNHDACTNGDAGQLVHEFATKLAKAPHEQPQLLITLPNLAELMEERLKYFSVTTEGTTVIRSEDSERFIVIKEQLQAALDLLNAAHFAK